MEIHDDATLARWLDSGGSLTGVRLQCVDLRPFEPVLLARAERPVVLGGVVSDRLRTHLLGCGAVVFTEPDGVPVPVYRSRLYTAAERFAGLDGGYAATPDHRAYLWSRDTRLAHDAYATLLRRCTTTPSPTRSTSGWPGTGSSG